MCTGDNVLTAVSVSRECGLVNKNTKTYIPRFTEGSSVTPRAEIVWENLDDPKDLLNSKTLKPLTQRESNYSNEFADETALFTMLIKGQIFARAEASVAAPFTSRTMDIGCVIEVIIEGRAALVTSFSCFMFMLYIVLFSLPLVSLLYSFDSNLGNLQFLLYRFVLNITNCDFNGSHGKPYPRIYPKRPYCEFSFSESIDISHWSSFNFNQDSIFVYFLIRKQPLVIHLQISIQMVTNIASYENTTLFLLSCYQYNFIAAVFSVGPPYRKSMFSNVPFILSTFSHILTSFILFFPTSLMQQIFELVILKIILNGGFCLSRH
ncbi:unnamed protein product [Rhizophagus irregularis]|nr:unnamed protein product [Rhizophagus irregularis]